jgi:Domain of unknown function (DUF5666)
MKTSLPTLGRWRQALAAGLAGSALAALLVACGGGGSDSAATGGGTATPLSFARGPISGLGSIIVGGVRFDDSTARVENDEDGSAHAARELKLGMMVEVQAGAIDDSTARATAATIRFGSEMVGAVQSIDATAQTVHVLDQTVEIKPTTVFEDGLAGFAAITLNQVLEIHAQFDATNGHYVATRVESEAGATVFRLRGLVSALNATDKTFKIGDALINFAGVAAANLPTTPLADGQRVRVRLQTAQVNAQWVALSVRSGVRRVDDIGDARLRGLVTAFTSPQHFEVQGVMVDATNATFEPNATAVKLGAIVDVRGSASNGTIVATRVKVRDGNEEEIRSVELHGTVSLLDAAAKTFMLREVKIDFSQVTTWKNGQASDLVNDKKVEVKGAWSADRKTLIASVVEFE